MRCAEQAGNTLQAAGDSPLLLWDSLEWTDSNLSYGFRLVWFFCGFSSHQLTISGILFLL